MKHFRAFHLRNGFLEVLDQRRLPDEVWIRVYNAFDGAQAIRNMAIRGAPMLGIFAAYCLYIHSTRSPESLKEGWLALKESRPTGINLHKVLDEARALVDEGASPEEFLKFAQDVESRERLMNSRICEYGLKLFEGPKSVLTYCNTGSLATAEPGTALGIIRTAFEKGLIKRVYVGETSPYLQGARITAYELKNLGIPYTIVPDNHLPFIISQGFVDMAIVGVDRITKDFYVFNKIGTLSIALACKRFRVPFVVSAPSTTFDEREFSGDMVVERRDDKPTNEYEYYAFDITPPDLLDFIISDKGIWEFGSQQYLGE